MIVKNTNQIYNKAPLKLALRLFTRHQPLFKLGFSSHDYFKCSEERKIKCNIPKFNISLSPRLNIRNCIIIRMCYLRWTTDVITKISFVCD